MREQGPFTIHPNSFLNCIALNNHNHYLLLNNMPLVLSFEQKEDYFRTLKRAFSDFTYFDSMLARSIRDLIDRSSHEDFDCHVMGDVLRSYLGSDYEIRYESKEHKPLLLTLKYALFAAVIFLHAKSAEAQSRFYQSADELLQAYPSFAQEVRELGPVEGKRELNYLLTFRNYMVAALLLLPAKENKIVLLRVLERLEGSNEQYITGTGQKASTTRRCLIYHQESGVPMTKKRPRKAKANSSSCMDVDEDQPEIEADLEMEMEVKPRKIRKVNRNGLAHQISATTVTVPLSAAVSTSSSLTPVISSQEVMMEEGKELKGWEELVTYSQQAVPVDFNKPPASSSTAFSFFPWSQGEENCGNLDSEEVNLLLFDGYEGSFTEDLTSMCL